MCELFQIKLADFGFARHFKDEGNKSVDMTSLAGTPVFMVTSSRSVHSIHMPPLWHGAVACEWCATLALRCDHVAYRVCVCG